MEVKIGKVIISDATAKRFIDMETGLPLSMIRVTYFGIRAWDKQLQEAFNKQAALPFESEILKTFVHVTGFMENQKEEKHEYLLLERADHVSSGCKKKTFVERGKEITFVVPQELRDDIGLNELCKLPHERLILRKDIPEIWLEK